ncbi:hypothetical protein NECAME_08666 [Necator americanus]|uniref:Uncharacterized protein n=1 Tax=Necator americanus TaxID=51031 RepID=W2TJ84_NECAM|nr:hypothetical protein NECAME_08666 [Necator americanus]ETN81226.1 hypothetical protein NECAME_08666 [Necator americanus]
MLLCNYKKKQHVSNDYGGLQRCRMLGVVGLLLVLLSTSVLADLFTSLADMQVLDEAFKIGETPLYKLEVKGFMSSEGLSLSSEERVTLLEHEYTFTALEASDTAPKIE